MAKNIRKNFTIRLTDAERSALTKESEMLGISPTEYIRTLMMHGKSRLYIEYLHSLVEQINVSMREIAEQKAAPQTTEISPAAASASPDVLQRILTGLQVLHTKMAQSEEKIEHIEAFCDARAQGAIGHLLLPFDVDATPLQKEGAERFARKFKKQNTQPNRSN